MRVERCPNCHVLLDVFVQDENSYKYVFECPNCGHEWVRLKTITYGGRDFED